MKPGICFPLGVLTLFLLSVQAVAFTTAKMHRCCHTPEDSPPQAAHFCYPALHFQNVLSCPIDKIADTLYGLTTIVASHFVSGVQSLAVATLGAWRCKTVCIDEL